MVCELKYARHVLTDEQQVQVVIRFICNTWEHMKVNMTQNKNIKIFKDIEHYLELEVEGHEAAKLSDHVFIAKSNSCKALGFKHKRGYKYNHKGNGFNPDKKKPCVKEHLKGRHAGNKKDKSKMRCYNYNKLGHLAHKYIELKKVRSNSTLLNYTLVMIFILLTEYSLMWTVDSRAIDHIACDRYAFVEYRRISQGTR